MSIFDKKQPEIDSSDYFAREESLLAAVSAYSGRPLNDTLDNKLDEELKEARGYAENGFVGYMDDSLASAKEYSAKLGRDITSEISELEKLGYTNAIPVEMKIARESWEEARAWEEYDYIDDVIEKIKEYSAKSGKDVSAEIKELEHINLMFRRNII